MTLVGLITHTQALGMKRLKVGQRVGSANSGDIGEYGSELGGCLDAKCVS
jgi:hypothetical protein